MTHDQVVIVALSAGWAGVVGLAGLAAAYLLRRRSLRWGIGIVAVVGVGGFAAGLVATARAMFLSEHDLSVVRPGLRGRGSGVAGLLAHRGRPPGPMVAVAAGRGPAAVRRGASLRACHLRPRRAAEVSEELRRTSRRLAESRDRERALEASRRELVAWVSHDLRTPLAGLRAMTEALEDGMVSDPARFHAQMRAEVDRMSRMVDDLFELSRIHAGALQLTIEPCARGPRQRRAGRRGARSPRLGACASTGAVRDGALVHADARELSRVMSNLLMNAIRHTPYDGAVEVSAG